MPKWLLKWFTSITPIITKIHSKTSQLTIKTVLKILKQLDQEAQVQGKACLNRCVFRSWWNANADGTLPYFSRENIAQD